MDEVKDMDDSSWFRVKFGGWLQKWLRMEKNVGGYEWEMREHVSASE